MIDELNPSFAFNLTATPLLVSLINDPELLFKMASEQLANRGLDIDRKWVGFPHAKQLHEERMITWRAQWQSANN